MRTKIFAYFLKKETDSEMEYNIYNIKKSESDATPTALFHFPFSLSILSIICCLPTPRLKNPLAGSSLSIDNRT
uniref:Uncharacterized protein n=1 Tax=Heterorhabditis bacteriophora TaxID=37862 RepID=A0A1I7X1M5_HETBA